MVTQKRIVESLAQYIQREQSKGEARMLWDKQFELFQTIYRFFLGGGKDGYVALPTGVGKTHLFIAFLQATQLRSLIVTPTNVLTAQTGARISRFAEELDYGAIDRYAKEYGRQITITTYASFVQQVRSGRLNPHDFDCLILDEAHMALGPQRVEAVQQFTHAVRLGFTATPDYSETRRVSNLLGKEICSMPAKGAIEDGLLANCSVILALTNASLEDVSVRAGRYREQELERAVNIAARNQAAVSLYREWFLGQRAVAYCVNVAHAEALAQCFLEDGVAAATIHGKTPRGERERLLVGFNTGTINVLCNADVLIHGFDEKRASVCLNLRPTLSRVIAEQRSGRVLRLDEDNPDKEAVIVDFLDRSGTSRYQPITYAEVLGASSVRRLQEYEDRGEAVQGSSIADRRIPTIRGLQVVVDAERVMRVVHDRRKHTAPPNQWLSRSTVYLQIREALSRLFDRPQTVTIRGFRLLDRLRNLHPEWFSTHRMPNGEELEFHDPAVIKSVIDEFKEAPDVWVDVDRFAARFGTSRGEVEGLAAQHCDPTAAAHIQEQENPEKEVIFILGTVLQHRVHGVWDPDTLSFYAPWLVQQLEKDLLGKGLTLQQPLEEGDIPSKPTEEQVLPSLRTMMRREETLEERCVRVVRQDGYISALNTLCQILRFMTPKYTVARGFRPRGGRRRGGSPIYTLDTWHCTVQTMSGDTVWRGSGASKKQATQEVYEQLIRQFGKEEENSGKTDERDQPTYSEEWTSISAFREELAGEGVLLTSKQLFRRFVETVLGEEGFREQFSHWFLLGEHTDGRTRLLIHRAAFDELRRRYPEHFKDERLMRKFLDERKPPPKENLEVVQISDILRTQKDVVALAALCRRLKLPFPPEYSLQHTSSSGSGQSKSKHKHWRCVIRLPSWDVLSIEATSGSNRAAIGRVAQKMYQLVMQSPELAS